MKQSRIRYLRVKANGGQYSQAEWEELKRQYNYQCLCCGRQEPEIKLVADHVIPVAKGGISDILNIQPLCQRCNGIKMLHRKDFRKPYLLRGLKKRAAFFRNFFRNL